MPRGGNRTLDQAIRYEIGLLLRNEYGWSFFRIADALGVGLSTVRAWCDKEYVLRQSARKRRKRHERTKSRTDTQNVATLQ